jgi:uncharacterized membrane protein (Fun14 family)
MSAESVQGGARRSVPGRFFAHVAIMPAWQKLVLVIAVLLASVGSVGWAMSHFSKTDQTRTTTTSTTSTPPRASTPAGTSSFIDNRAGTATPSTTVETTSTATNQAPGLIDKFSPGTTRIGVSVVAGFILGWLFRAFLKTMTFFALIAGAILFGLSYFGVLNVDFSAAREHYASAMHWLTDQGERIKDVVIGHLPSSGGGALGMFMGFRRK